MFGSYPATYIPYMNIRLLPGPGDVINYSWFESIAQFIPKYTKYVSTTIILPSAGSVVFNYATLGCLHFPYLKVYTATTISGTTYYFDRPPTGTYWTFTHVGLATAIFRAFRRVSVGLGDYVSATLNGGTFVLYAYM